MKFSHAADVLQPYRKTSMKKLILASASPRRRDLLKQAGYEFQILPARKDEIIHSEDPAQIVKELSAGKAGEISDRLLAREMPSEALSGENLSAGELSGTGLSGDDYVILGADTIVVLDGKVLGKPTDEQDAFAMLTALQGRSHQVYTGVTIWEVQTAVDPDDQDTEQKKEGEMEKSPLSFAVCTEVEFSPLTPEEIYGYIATGEPMDKAGAYGIQGIAGAFIRGIRGDYSSVVGLPLCPVYQALSRFGIRPAFTK